MAAPVLTLTDPGRRVSYATLRSGRKDVTIDRRWDVHLDGVYIGRIVYRMLTRERGPRQARYVTSRWESPGWVYYAAESPNGFEADSKRAAIDVLVARAAR
jgi:hypothetical protein